MRTPTRTLVASILVAALVAALVTALSLGIAPSGASAQHGDPAPAERGRQRIVFGAYTEGMQAHPERLRAFERKVRARARIASYYYGYGDIFPAAPEQHFANAGRRRVLVSWDMGPTRFTEWTRGDHDAYLDQIVSYAVAYGDDVYVRPWPEMNGDWQTFQPTPQGELPHGGTYADFKAAWRYVVTYTRSRGATNLKWVFNPAADTYAETTPVGKIWPGAAYVDVLGIDGFNWGKDNHWGRWLSFGEIFRPMYRKLTRLHPHAPVWICEFGSKEPSRSDGAPRDPRHSKAAWLEEAFRTAKRMSRIEALIYFNERKERDWRVNSSRSSLKAIRQLI